MEVGLPFHLTLAVTAAASGFETAIPISSAGPCFQVKALDSLIAIIGVSAVTVAGSSSCP